MIDSMSRPVIAVTQRIDNIPDRDERRDAIDQRLLNWLFHTGFMPVSVPNIFFDDSYSGELSGNAAIETWLQAIRPTAVLLSGGNDIGEYPARDGTERFLLSWAKTKKIPALGICRGLQMMAVWAGASLVHIEGHVNTQHSLVVSEEKEKENWPDCVNSYHNWCLSACPDGFEIMAKTEDGSIEAILHSDLPWEGWMWHPERAKPFTDQDTKRVQRLFNGH